MQNNTLNFYNANAAAYAADGQSPNPKLSIFFDKCKKGGHVLEMGTGSGVDARAIIDAGFQLDATDGSCELAVIASRFIGQPVRQMMFNELDAIETYDGIYACAALTHAPRNQLGVIIQKIHKALKNGGVVWASFKTGGAEGSDALGRFYNYLSVPDLLDIWQKNAAWSQINLDQWQGSAYDKKTTEWAAIIAVR
ncbi:methyltransferase domain-containing protein [Paenochrobactrum sp. BZR 588]|uniref:methyltransferase domain-containing protein n=1 Tax=Paenochrobactrum TaxID=999488 RepID=UPI0035BC7337